MKKRLLFFWKDRLSIKPTSHLFLILVVALQINELLDAVITQNLIYFFKSIEGEINPIGRLVLNAWNLEGIFISKILVIALILLFGIYWWLKACKYPKNEENWVLAFTVVVFYNLFFLGVLVFNTLNYLI